MKELTHQLFDEAYSNMSFFEHEYNIHLVRKMDQADRNIFKLYARKNNAKRSRRRKIWTKIYWRLDKKINNLS